MYYPKYFALAFLSIILSFDKIVKLFPVLNFLPKHNQYDLLKFTIKFLLLRINYDLFATYYKSLKVFTPIYISSAKTINTKFISEYISNNDSFIYNKNNIQPNFEPWITPISVFNEISP